MNRFEKSPHFKSILGCKLNEKPFVLTQPLVYRTDVLPDIPRIEMPTGFRSDFATIPRLARRLFSVAGWWRGAAWPHDFCCAPVDADGNAIPHFCNYKQAAAIFYEALESIVSLMDLSPKKKEQALRKARFLVWCVKVGGPKFEEGEM